MTDRERAMDPNTPAEDLLELVERFPREVRENPALTLIQLSDPDLAHRILALAELSLAKGELEDALAKVHPVVRARFALRCAAEVLPFWEATATADREIIRPCLDRAAAFLRAPSQALADALADDVVRVSAAAIGQKQNERVLQAGKAATNAIQAVVVVPDNEENLQQALLAARAAATAQISDEAGEIHEQDQAIARGLRSRLVLLRAVVAEAKPGLMARVGGFAVPILFLAGLELLRRQRERRKRRRGP